MIKFFRKIRQDLLRNNKTGDYLKYAVGEIVLVVIGILIALSINNWNESRKNDLKQALLVKNIIEDLRLDFIHINKSLEQVSNQMNLIDDLISKIFDEKKKINYDSIGLIRFSSDFRPISGGCFAFSTCLLLMCLSSSNLIGKHFPQKLQGFCRLATLTHLFSA